MAHHQQNAAAEEHPSAVAYGLFDLRTGRWQDVQADFDDLDDDWVESQVVVPLVSAWDVRDRAALAARARGEAPAAEASS